MPTYTDEQSAVLEAVHNEMTRQETRVDMKANQLLTVTSILISLSVLAITTQHITGILAVVPLSMAILFWMSALVILLIRVVRPRLGPQYRFAALDDDTIGGYWTTRVNELNIITRTRFRAIRTSVTFIVYGFGFFILAGIAALLNDVLSS